MEFFHLFSSTLVFIPANNIMQYALLGSVVLYAGLRLVQPLLPSARMAELEKIVVETVDILHSASEERLLHRESMFQFQLRLSRVNVMRSSLRTDILAFESGYATCEYLRMLQRLSVEIEACKRETKKIQVAILTEIEQRQRELYHASIDDMAAILASGCSGSSRQRL
ncbi:hypothetical protein R3P38DRAFT_2821065, partial [Favolaschia claudopus]